MHFGTVHDMAALTAEHLKYSHPSLVVLLSKIFNSIMLSGNVLSGLKSSYIVHSQS